MVLCAAAKVDAAALTARVDDVWAARLTQPDPLVQGCQRDEVRGVQGGRGELTPTAEHCAGLPLRSGLINAAYVHALLNTCSNVPVVVVAALTLLAAVCACLCVLQIQKRLDDWMESCIKQESEKK